MLDPNFQIYFRDFYANLPKTYDICQFYHHPGQVSERMKAHYRLNRYVLKSYSPWGLNGYLVSLKGAKKILKVINPIRTAVDDMVRMEIDNDRLESYMPAVDLILVRCVLTFIRF